jgi:hypothetical protein
MKYSYLLVTIPMVLSTVTGFVIAFVLLPHWLFRRYTLTTLRKVVAVFALVGLWSP